LRASDFCDFCNVSELEFNVPFQHKCGYIRDKRSGVESYPYPVKKASDILAITLGAFLFSSHPIGLKGITRIIQIIT